MMISRLLVNALSIETGEDMKENIGEEEAIEVVDNVASTVDVEVTVTTKTKRSTTRIDKKKE